MCQGSVPSSDDANEHAVQVRVLSPAGTPAADHGHRPQARLLGDPRRVDGPRTGRLDDRKCQRAGRVRRRTLLRLRRG